MQLMTTKTAGVIAPQHCHRHEQALAAAVRPSPSPAFSHPCPGSSFPARSALERSRRHSLGSGRCGRCRIGKITFAPFSVSHAHSRAGSCFRAKTRRAGFVSHARLRVQGPFAAFRGYQKLCTFNISCIQLPPALSTSAAFSFPLHFQHQLHSASPCTFSISCIQLPPALSASAAFSFPLHFQHQLHSASRIPLTHFHLTSHNTSRNTRLLRQAISDAPFGPSFDHEIVNYLGRFTVVSRFIPS
jgi:hypothetical protein